MSEGRLYYSEWALLERARKCLDNEADFTAHPAAIVGLIERLAQTRASRDKAARLLADRQAASLPSPKTEPHDPN